MTETALIAFWTFFATVGPLDVSALFAALTAENTPKERRSMAIRGVMIGGGILIFFALLGDTVLLQLGVTMPALRTAGGILLLLMAIDMVFARSSGGNSTTEEENKEAAGKKDISVFPLATPMVGGPGAIGAAVLLMADAEGDPAKVAAVLGALVAILILTLIFLLLSGQLNKLLGVTGMQVVARIVGILLAAMAVQFIFDGVKGSAIFS